ncbi:MAG TPA: zinc-binding dehydrogenase [Acidimicrobiales bacterium]|nr:zinc-binding dehydrogenase [Acidimicrobiales bacterium]
MPRQLRSTVTEAGTLELSIAEVDAPRPRDHEVVIRVEAAPINPSDLGVIFGPADMGTARESGEGAGRTITADIPENLRRMVETRIGQSVPIGNEGAGIVVEAGSSDDAQALLGATVATLGGAMYSQFRVAAADQCLVLPAGVTPAQGASCFVNPLTALGMVETMRLEGHTALVHTAAASNLGQMLVKLCLADDIALVNIVRRQEQAELLAELGATRVCNSADGGFMASLIEAVAVTDATIGFDATGGGTLASKILTAMEAAQAAKTGAGGRYGSATHKQVYVYGGLDRSPTQLTRSFGMAWGLGGWLLPLFLDRIGPQRSQELRERVASEITTTFASNYTAVVSLEEALSLDAIAAYGRQATGSKYLVDPNKDLP